MSEGYFFVFGTCFICKGIFGFNPELITCPRVNLGHGEEPVTCCERCMTLVNAEKVERGLPPFPILPGAYQPAPGP
jgi:hypothetical protein